MTKSKITSFLPCSIFAIIIIVILAYDTIGQTNENITIKKIAEFQWDTKNGLPFHKGYSANYGFSSFEVINDIKIAFLCNTERSIRIFDLSTNKFISEINLGFIPQDFTYYNNQFYVLEERSVVVFNKFGDFIQKFILYNTNSYLNKIKVVDEDVFVLSTDDNSYQITKNNKPIEPVKFDGVILSNRISGKSTKINDYQYLIEINKDHTLIFREYFNTSKKIGSVRILGMDQNNIYIDIEYIKKDKPLRVEREMIIINIYNLNSDQIIKVALPSVYSIYMKSDIQISKIGYYHIVTTPDKILLFKGELQNLIPSTLTDQIESSGSYPSELSNYNYHYNNHTLSIDNLDNSALYLLKGEFVHTRSPLNRDSIISDAVKYESYQWFADSSNITDSFCGGKDVVTPDWVRADTINRSIPYMWGGNSSLFGFNQGLLEGKSAGDIITNTSFGAPNCAEGLDCSGLISRVWDLPYKHSTRTLPNISTEYPEGFTQLKPGDIINWVGHHTRLVIKNNANGTIDCIEATKGYEEWRVLFRNYSYTQLQGDGYIPLCNNNLYPTNSINSKEEKIKLEIFPIPSSGKLQVKLDNLTEKNITIEIRNICGQIIFTNLFTNIFNNTNIEIDLTDHSKGIYFLHLTNGKKTVVSKLLIQ